MIDKAVENYSQVWCWSKWMLKNAETIEQHEATSTLLEDAPLLLAEVEKLQAWKKLVSDIVQQHDGSHLRKMLKELTK